MRLVRHPNESTEDFLFRIYNDKGCRDLAVSANYIHNAETRWTTKIRYDFLMSLSDWQYVKGTYNANLKRPFKKTEFVNHIAHRTILDIEVMLDIDETDHPYIEFDSIEQKARYVFDQLRNKGKDPTVYFTRSKSYHIGFLDRNLRLLRPFDRQRYREKIIERYGADLGLASDIRTVSLEGALHYKSGKLKQEVRW